MYVSPRITDFGRIELHTHVFPGSSSEVSEETAVLTGESTGGGSGGGAGLGVGVIGLIGGAIALAGRGDNNQAAAAVPPDEEVEKLAQK